MSLLNFNIRKVSQKGGAPCNTGLDFINNVECQTNVDITNGKLKIDGVNYTAYEIDKDLFGSLITASDFIKYERELTKENKLTNPDTLKKNEITRFMAVVKKNDSSIPQYTTIINNHNQSKGKDGKKKNDEEIELFTLVNHDDSIIPSLTFKNIEEGEEPQFIKDLREDGVEILKDVNKNQTWKIYTKKYTEREQAQRDGGEGLHPGYDLISFFNTFKNKLPQLKLINQSLMDFLTDEQKTALGLDNQKLDSKSIQNNEGKDVKNPLKWNDNTNIEIKHTINGEEITKYKDIMNNGKKIAQMSVGKTNQYKNEGTKSACTIFALGAIEFLLKNNNLNELKYKEIWGENGIETGALEKYNRIDKKADHTTIEEAMKSFSTSLNNKLIFPRYTKGNFDINLENNEALIVVSIESISVTKKNNKYYVYDSHPHGGNSNIGNTQKFKGMDYKNSCICIFNEKENVNNFLNLRYPIPNIDSLTEFQKLLILEIDVEKITLNKRKEEEKKEEERKEAIQKTRDSIQKEIITEFIKDIEEKFKENNFNIDESRKNAIVEILTTAFDENKLKTERDELYNLLLAKEKKETKISDKNLDDIYRMLIQQKFTN